MKRWRADELLEAFSSEFEALERVRGNALIEHHRGEKAIRYSVIVSLSVALTTGFAAGLVPGIMAGFVCIFLAIIITSIVASGSERRRYLLMFKAGLLPKLVKHIEPGMHYEPGGGISESLFRQSGFYSQKIDRYHGEDLFKGIVGNTKLMFSEVKAEYEDKEVDDEGEETITHHTFFRGVFIVADFHKEFSTPLMVLPDFGERYLGLFGKKLQRLGGELQRMENPEFEKHFVVRGADPVEARYLLTPKMQESLLTLQKRFEGNLMVSFRESLLFLAIPTHKDHFEFSVKRAAHDEKQLDDFLFQFWLYRSLVEELDLNTRIWTKK